MDQSKLDLESDPDHKLGYRLIVVDPRVSGYQSWLDSLVLSYADVLVLDADQDGLQQIAKYMLGVGADPILTTCAD